MGFRYQRRIKICKGVNINLSKSGVGLSVGPKGAKIGISSKGKPYASVGIPGTGLSYRTNLPTPKSHPDTQQKTTPEITQSIKPKPPKKLSDSPIAIMLLVIIIGGLVIWGLASVLAVTTANPYGAPPSVSAHSKFMEAN
jgi:hypothetical protein